MLCPYCNKEIVEDASNYAQRQYEPKRTYQARDDASVGSITRTIEKVFGLPKGSVVIRTPEKKVFRSNARISTVRERWE